MPEPGDILDAVDDLTVQVNTLRANAAIDTVNGAFYRQDQARKPAGQTGGGRWVDEDGVSSGGPVQGPVVPPIEFKPPKPKYAIPRSQGGVTEAELGPGKWHSFDPPLEAPSENAVHNAVVLLNVERKRMGLPLRHRYNDETKGLTRLREVYKRSTVLLQCGRDPRDPFPRH